MNIFGSCGQKGAALLLVALFCAPALAAAAPASAAPAERCAPDSLLGAPFVACGTEAEGGFRSTLVRLPFRGGDSAAAPKANVLYVHGFNDYFFQRELAERLDSAGYAFWAVDLHKYGRSWREGERRGAIDSVEEYFPELDSALAAMRRVHDVPAVLLGHSTGGLVVSCYAASRGRGRGLAAIALNSPFFEMNQNLFVRGIGVPAVSALASLFPGARLPRSGNTNYARS
ncbi:MAG: alpha/beta hydrolase, partial [Fibrobacterales bacterium]|nr:alpha/beta hydrolase [Fibrobacterales bacterium]